MYVCMKLWKAGKFDISFFLLPRSTSCGVSIWALTLGSSWTPPCGAVSHRNLESSTPRSISAAMCSYSVANLVHSMFPPILCMGTFGGWPSKRWFFQKINFLLSVCLCARYYLCIITSLLECMLHICTYANKLKILSKYWQEEIFNLSSGNSAEPMHINQTQTAFWPLDPASNPLLVAASSAKSPRHGRCIDKITVEVMLALDMRSLTY